MISAEGPAIIVVGNVADGFDFIGPFPTVHDASAYAEDNHDGDEYHIVDLIAPQG